MSKLEHILNTAAGQTFRRYNDSLVITFTGPRTIAGSSMLNGGVREGIASIFNHTIPDNIKTAEDLPGGSVERYLAITARNLGLNPDTSSGLLTSAGMSNAALETHCFRSLEVRAAITAGVDVNGVRAGDPACYYEERGRFIPLQGTVNILLTINANLPPGTLLKSVITATEAKTAALQELLAPSRYSAGLATGSGTDGIIVAADPASQPTLTDAGGHAVLGELIGRAVTAGVKKALVLETGLSPQRQMNVLERVKRFGVDTEYILRRAAAAGYPSPVATGDFRAALARLLKNPPTVALASAVVHLQDQVHWGLLPESTALDAAQHMLHTPGVKGGPPGNREGNSNKKLINMLVDWLNETLYRELGHTP